jgi:RNA recognition motif-containing protein
MAPEEESRGVFLRGIPVETTEAELREIFSKCGPISRINIVQSKTHETNTAYVDFDTREAMVEALRQHGAEMGEKEGSVTACRLTIRGMQVPVLEKLPPGRRPQGMMYSRGGGDFRRGGAGEAG